MANNYLLFSTEIRIKPESADWIKARLGIPADAEGDAADRCPFLQERGPADDPAFATLGFEWGLEPTALWLYTEESGNMAQVAEFVAELLTHEESEEKVLIEWAETCSKARPGEFGGGAVAISAHQIQWMPAAWTWFRGLAWEHSGTQGV